MRAASGRRSRASSSRSTVAAPMVPGFLSLLDVPTEDASWDALDQGQRRRRTVDGLGGCSSARARSSRCAWYSRTSTGSMSRRRVSSTRSSRAFRRRGSCCSSTTGRSTATAGGARRTTASSGSTRFLPRARMSLLRALLGEHADLEPIKRLLVERTEGVPFFLEESVRTLVETGALAGERGDYRLARPFDTIQVPATVQAILAARIDRLPPEDKTLLQTAAVIGKDVPFALLQAISEMPEEALRDGLGRLQAAEFLYETALFPELEYTFKHALTQEVAYGGLLQERRRALHAEIVRAFETLYPGQHERANELADPSCLPGRGVGPRSGLHARCDFPSLDGYLSGFTGGDNPGAAWWMGDHEHAVRAAQRELGASPAIAEAGVHPRRRHEPSSRAGVPLARPVLAGHGLPAQEPRADQRRPAAAIPSPWQCCPRSSPGSGSRCALPSGESSREGSALATRRSGSPRSGDPGYSFVLACAGLGNVCLTKGDFDHAITVLERGMSRAISSEIINRAWPFVASALGAAYTHLGRVDDGLPLLEQAVERAEAMNLRANQSLRLARLAEAHAEGRPGRESVHGGCAGSRSGPGAPRARARGPCPPAAGLGRGRARGARPRPGRVRLSHGARARRATRHATTPGTLPPGPRRLYRRKGNPETAAAEVAAARSLFHAMDMAFWFQDSD